MTFEGEECAIMTNGGHVQNGGLYRLVGKTIKWKNTLQMLPQWEILCCGITDMAY